MNNPNIEVITPDIWGASMNMVRAGRIPELTANSTAKDQINLTNTGLIVLDMDSTVYTGLKHFFAKAYKHSDQDLQTEFIKAGAQRDSDSGVDLWYNILGFEIKRRKIKRDYQEKQITDRIIAISILPFWKGW